MNIAIYATEEEAEVKEKEEVELVSQLAGVLSPVSPYGSHQ